MNEEKVLYRGNGLSASLDVLVDGLIWEICERLEERQQVLLKDVLTEVEARILSKIEESNEGIQVAVSFTDVIKNMGPRLTKVEHGQEAICHRLEEIKDRLTSHPTLDQTELTRQIESQVERLSLEWFVSQTESTAKSLIRALDQIHELKASTNPSGAEHLASIERQLGNALGELSVEAIDIRQGDPFDPQIMDALSTRPVVQADEHRTVLAVQRIGYRQMDQILRPADVEIGQFNEKESRYDTS